METKRRLGEPETDTGRQALIVSTESHQLFPYWDRPWMAGMYGALAAHASTATFALFAGIDVKGLEWPRIKTAAIGFVAACLIRLYLNWWNRRAVTAAARERGEGRGDDRRSA